RRRGRRGRRPPGGAGPHRGRPRRRPGRRPRDHRATGRPGPRHRHPGRRSGPAGRRQPGLVTTVHPPRSALPTVPAVGEGAARPRAAVAVLAGWVAAAVALVVWGLVEAAKLDFNDNVYAGQQYAIGFVCVPVGAWLAWQRPRHPLGWVILGAG